MVQLAASLIPSPWSVVALVNGESSHQNSDEGEIHNAFALIHQQRRQQEIMKEEKEKIDCEFSPDDEHLRPIECEIGVADGAHIQT